ncbi:hypothetical protein A8C75_01295 [Marinobacterium aestuarii]|uniref:Sulfotransferase n=1 Tax=Marinobacterium aestuarii TaxID=1821621 RepID=A0A1A9ETJ2_9GAMM|nr:sulfotransferase family 2 domain-containing protein [Marinobacterium aestuarii]ANG61226.1 hypothetical protein A8C75_01295 [Marinobacterium aestuarii]
MVINSHYQFIFVHIPKSAGTSVMKSLSQLRGNNKRWLANTKHETLVDFDAQFESRKNLYDRVRGMNPRNYYRFGFVRNPWDRMSSFYRYLTEKQPRHEIMTISSFKDFLIKTEEGCDWIQTLHTMRPQIDYFTNTDGNLNIDFLGHFEFLQEDLELVGERIGCRIKLPHLNSSTNSKRDYRSEFDNEMIEIVARRFREDIAHFGYAFDNIQPSVRCSKALRRPRAL